MSTATLLPNGEGTISQWRDEAAGTSNLWQKVDAGLTSPNDSDYIRTVGTPNSIFLLLENTPGDFGEITDIDVKVRALKDAGGTATITAQVFKSDETTALTDAVASSNLTGSFADYTIALSLTGDVDQTSWDGARLKLTASDADVWLSETQAEITYDLDSPVYTGGAGTTIGAVTASASGTFAKPAYTAAAAATTPHVTATADASASEEITDKTATAAATIGAVTASANVSHTKPTYTASCAAIVGRATAAASGQSAWLHIASAAGATIGAVTAQAMVEVDVLLNTATAASNAPAATAAASIVYEGVGNATAAANTGGAIALASATFQHPFRSWFARNANLVIGRGSRA